MRSVTERHLDDLRGRANRWGGVAGRWLSPGGVVVGRRLSPRLRPGGAPTKLSAPLEQGAPPSRRLSPPPCQTRPSARSLTRSTYSRGLLVAVGIRIRVRIHVRLIHVR